MRAVELHSVRKVRATKSRVRLGKKEKKSSVKGGTRRFRWSNHFCITVYQFQFFSDFAVALCKKAVRNLKDK